jgi:thioesterase domain-containing protein
MTNTRALLDEFSQQARRSIPMLATMDMRFTELGDHSLRVDMPLGPNINDKQTGFGGSISALATAAGWAIVSLLLKPRFSSVDVVIAESHMRYLAPATRNFYAIASISKPAMSAFKQLLDAEHCGRITLQVMIEQDGEQIAVFTATYRAKIRSA